MVGMTSTSTTTIQQATRTYSHTPGSLWFHGCCLIRKHGGHGCLENSHSWMMMGGLPRQQQQQRRRRQTRDLVIILLVVGLWLVVTSTDPPYFCLLPQANHDLLQLPHAQPRNNNNKNKLNAAASMTLYSVARSDRPGSSLHDMLMAHAHAFARNWTYGGACSVVYPKVLHQEETQTLIDALGLGAPFLQFACPPKYKPQEQPVAGGWLDPSIKTKHLPLFENNTKSKKNYKILPDKVYRRAGTGAFTPEWRQRIQQHLPTGSLLSKEKDDDTMTVEVVVVVIHIRRGDVHPCRSNLRYLPNSHYQRILQRYVLHELHSKDNDNHKKKHKQNTTVLIKIHSEMQSFEPWINTTEYWVGGDGGGGDGNHEASLLANNSNHQINVQVDLHLDAPLHSAWYDMMTANVLILSRSSFSFVPAILRIPPTRNNNKNNDNHSNRRLDQVIYTPFWHEPLSDWTIVDQELMQQTQQELVQLQHQPNCKVVFQ